MADSKTRGERNVDGRWFVDEACVACGLCIELAFDNLELDWDAGLAFVKKQPSTPEEEEALAEAADQCPVEAIGAAPP